MPRLPMVREDDPTADPEAVALLRQLEATYGSVNNMQRVMVHNTGVAKAFFLDMMRTLYFESHLSPKQIELPYLTSTMMLESYYCTPTHVTLARGAGITDEQMLHLGDDPLPEGLFSPDEEAIIRYAQASARMRPITEEIWQDLQRFFDPTQLIELCMMVGLSQMASRFNATFHPDVDDATLEAVGSVCGVPLPPSPGGTGAPGDHGPRSDRLTPA